MAKSLKDILAGVKSSKVVPGSTGVDPGVDYMPKAPAEQDFVAKHKTEKHADRVGNGDDVYKGKTAYSLKTKQNKLMGNDLAAAKAANEEVEAEEESDPLQEAKACEECGKDPCGCDDMPKKGKKLRFLLGGKKSPVKEEVEELDEISKKKLENYKKKAVPDLLTAKKEVHDAEEYARHVAKLKKQGRASDSDVETAHRKAVKIHDKIQNRQTGLALAQEKINKKTKKPTNEEVEEINEIGDTAKGRERLKKYVSHKLSKDPKLDKDVKRAYDANVAAGRDYRQARKEKVRGKATDADVKRTKEKSDKRHKIYWGRIEKVRKNETDVTRAQQRISSKGKDIKKPLASKTMVDNAGVRKTETRRPGLEENYIFEVITSKTSVSDIIHDFVHSDNPKFAGKSKEERKRMALGAYYAKHPEKSNVKEDAAEPMLEGGKKKKMKAKKESGPDGPIYPSGQVPYTTQNIKADTGYAI